MPPDPFNQRFDALVKELLDRWHTPGIAFGVVHNDDSWSKGYGIAQLPSTPVDTKTLFYAASTTKAHLCAAWALYINSEVNKSKPSDQQITFATPLADLIPEDFVLSEANRTSQITIEDAVSHRTGMPRHENSYGYAGVATPKELVRNLRNLPLRTPLRSTFEYCNMMYVAASLALEKVTGKPLSQVLRESLWEPLGMNDTYAGYSEAIQAVKAKQAVLARGYIFSKSPGDVDEHDGTLIEQEYLDGTEFSGAGYAITTADDYVKWMRAWLQSSKGPLTDDAIKEIWTSRSIVDPSEEGGTPYQGVVTYGLGWFICMYRGHMVYRNPGGLTGAGSTVILVPSLNWGVCYFANILDTASKFQGAALELLDEVLCILESERTAFKSNEAWIVESHQKMAKKYNNALTRLFPGAHPHPSVPPALPLHAYAGTYHHKGYGDLTFHVKDDGEGGHLFSDMRNRTWGSSLILRHVNAENWIATEAIVGSPSKQALKVGTRIGGDCKLEAMGVAMECAMPEHLFWFRRIDAPAM